MAIVSDPGAEKQYDGACGAVLPMCIGHRHVGLWSSATYGQWGLLTYVYTQRYAIVSGLFWLDCGRIFCWYAEMASELVCRTDQYKLYIEFGFADKYRRKSSGTLCIEAGT